MRLIDADAAYKAACEGADNWDGAYSPYRYDRIREEMDKVPTASPWHRVEELPKEEHRTYLVYTDTGYMCSCRWTNNVYGLGASDRWGWCLADIPQFQEVVYWMPVPEPPKEDA